MIFAAEVVDDKTRDDALRAATLGARPCRIETRRLSVRLPDDEKLPAALAEAIMPDAGTSANRLLVEAAWNCEAAAVSERMRVRSESRCSDDGGT